MVPMHTLWACVLQLCTIQVCTTPLCTIQLCTIQLCITLSCTIQLRIIQLCTTPLCTIQLCTIQLQIVQAYSSHQRSVPVCTAQACLIQLLSILPHFIPVPPAWGCVPEPPPVLPMPPQRLAWPLLLPGRISAPPRQQLQLQLPVQCRQQGRAALRGLRSGFCQPAVQDGAGLCRKPPLAKRGLLPGPGSPSCSPPRAVQAAVIRGQQLACGLIAARWGCALQSGCAWHERCISERSGTEHAAVLRAPNLTQEARGGLGPLSKQGLEQG